MSAVAIPGLQHLVPDRDCGTCNACCIWLTIDDPELRKAQGLRCGNLRSDGGCSVYATRPRTCHEFYCGFRRLDWVPDSMRPDLSNVLIGLQYDGPPSDPSRRLGVSFSLLTEAALEADGLAETVAASVTSGLPVWLHVPGPPGYTAAAARIDEVMREPVRQGDLSTVLRILQIARAKAQQASSNLWCSTARVSGSLQGLPLTRPSVRAMNRDRPIRVFHDSAANVTSISTVRLGWFVA